jgi:hypothetical protein
MLTGFLKYIVDLILEFVVKKAIEVFKSMKERKSQSQINKENLKKIEEAKTDDEKLEKQVDLLNGRKS